MNNLQQPQNMGSTWHSMYSPQDRQKVIQIVLSTLKDIQGNNYDAQKAQTMAQEFEKFTFMKAPSRDEYLRSIKQKITQLRSGSMRNMAAASAASNPNNIANNNNNNNTNNNINAPARNPTVPNNTAGMVNNLGPQNNMNHQSMNFLQQQAQARQQSAAQIQAQMRNNQQQQQQQVQPPSQPQQPPTQQPQQPQGSNQGSNQGSMNNTGLQQNSQIQQIISNMIKNVPIPQALLSKIPNLPPNCNTWTQIFDCFQKKIIPHSAMPVIRDIHNTHMQFALRQHQQQRLNQFQKNQQPQQSQQQGNQNTQQNNQNKLNLPAGLPANFNLNNLTPQQKQQLLQRQLQQQQQNNNNNALQNQQKTQPQPVPQNDQNQIPPQVQQPPQSQQPPQPQQPQQSQQQNQQGLQGQQQARPANTTITPEDIVRYSSDALTLLATLQNNGSIPRELDQNQKQSFIRKYIHHQKLSLWKQQQRNNLNIPPNQAIATNSNDAVNQAQIQRRLQAQAEAQAQQQNQQGQQGQANQGLASQIPSVSPATAFQPQPQPQGQPGVNGINNVPPQQLPLINNMHIPNQQIMRPQGQMNNLSSPLMQQRGLAPTPAMNNANLNNANAAFNPNAPSTSVPPTNPSAQVGGTNQQPPQPQGIPGAGGRPNTTANPINNILPPLNDEMKVRLRKLFEEVSRNTVPLRDVTLLLSPQDKKAVGETLAKISQQYANVDTILSYFYVLTKNLEGTKRLIQMKHMTRNIVDNLRRGVYLAGPDLLEKLRTQYQKYFDYVKEQIAMRRQLQQRQGQQRQGANGAPGSQQSPQFMNNQLNGTVPMPNQISPQLRNAMIPDQNQRNNMRPQANWNNMGKPVIGQQAPQAPIPTQPQMQQGQLPQGIQPTPNLQPRLRPQSGAFNSSPMMPNMASPMMANTVIPNAQQPAFQQTPQQQPAPTPSMKAKDLAAAQKKSISGPGSGRRKGSTKATQAAQAAQVAAANISTPAAAVVTPATLANTIKTPNSIPTPQVPQTHSNKNTPTGQSPNYPNKPSSSSSILVNKDAAVGDIFNHSGADSKLARRRELSNSDPEKFFYASLANLLELPDPEGTANNSKGSSIDMLNTPISIGSVASTTSNQANSTTTGGTTANSSPLVNGKSNAKSPLSPHNVNSSNQWTCEIRPDAIVSAFRQVDGIRELAANDIISTCSHLAELESQSKSQVPSRDEGNATTGNLESQGIKRENDQMEDFDDIEGLFDEKKIKLDDISHNQFMFEPVAFDDWKQFVVTSLQ